jgi:hypothetical protein
MLDKMFDSLKVDNAIQHMTSLMNSINQTVAHFSEEFVKDQNFRDSALDALGDLFKSLKTNSVVAQ